MQLDSFFTKGESHKICQDYAYTDRKNSIVSISDGCSAAKDVDVGARLICRIDPAHPLGQTELLKRLVVDLDLPQESLYCTALTLVPVGDKIYFSRYGDGFLAYQTKSGLTYVTCYSYAVNAPYYVGYEVYGETESYLNIADNSLLKHTITFDKDFNVKDRMYARLLEKKDLLEESIDFDTDSLNWIGVASDGLASFTDKESMLVDIEEIIPHFFNFKTTAGQFVQRRAQRAFADLKKEGITNFDDVSIGVISL